MIQNLEKLCSKSGISGREKAVSEEIEQQINGHCEYHYDNLGNLIAVKKGKNQANHKVMISAQKDEVGMNINSDNSYLIAVSYALSKISFLVISKISL